MKQELQNPSVKVQEEEMQLQKELRSPSLVTTRTLRLLSSTRAKHSLLLPNMKTVAVVLFAVFLLCSSGASAVLIQGKRLLVIFA